MKKAICLVRIGRNRPCTSPENHAGLLPDDAMPAPQRNRLELFAALNTIEPPIVELSMATILEHDKNWYEGRLPMLNDRIRVRLDELSGRSANPNG